MRKTLWTILILTLAGGGGFGNPLDRKLSDIEDDVRNGYISQASAREHYGAVLDPHTLRADHAASRELRAAMRAQGLPHDHPLTSQAPGRRKAPPPRLRLLPKAAREMTEEAREAGLLAARCCS